MSNANGMRCCPMFYREVPQATVGFSPFELMFGREIRGLLDILKEEWVTTENKEMDVLTYVTKKRERMAEAQQTNSQLMQEKQKEYYDKKTREIKVTSWTQSITVIA